MNKKINNKKLNKRNNKKGQITIFIILGIIVLFAVALVIYWQNSFNKVRPPVQQLIVDESVRPVQLYVTDCLEAISKDGLIRLGQNGGYITIPAGLKINPAKPYDSDGLFFPPQNMPYWYYMKPCSQSSAGCIYLRDPPVCNNGVDCVLPYRGQNSMEEQLNVFISENLNSCIRNFETFNDRFEITAGEISVDTKIADSKVWFKMDYPLTVKVKGTSSSVDIPYFYTEHDVNLKQIYTFAREIRDAQANYTFLERNTLNLMTVYSGVDSNIPPMAGFEMFNPSSRKVWIRTEVKEAFKSEILPYTMLLQIVNAGNAKTLLPRGTNPKYIGVEEGLYQAMTIKVSNTSSYPFLDANIYYPPDGEIYLRVGDGSEIIKPKSFDGGDNMILKLMSFAVTDYSFKYDISYPVIVTLKDPYAFNGEGYTFSYAMQANIRQNVPMSTNITTTGLITVPSLDLEDPTQRVERKITIETYDKYTKEPLGDVLITYKCGYEVPIGMTKMNKGKASLVEQFPFCEVGGEILFEKKGYMGGVVDYTNDDGSSPVNFRIEMWPLQEKKIKVYKRTVSDINSIRSVGAGGIVLYNTAYSNLTENDTVFLNINRVKDDDRETDVPLVGFAAYTQEGKTIKPSSKQEQIEYIEKLFLDGVINQSVHDSLVADLSIPSVPVVPTQYIEQEYLMEFVPGKYNVDAFMMYDGLIHIPKMTQKIEGQKILGVCVIGCDEIEFPEQNFTSWISGGVQLNFTLTENDVYNDKTLVFFVAEMPIPTNWNMMQNAPSIESYQEDKLTLLRPTLKD